MKSQEFAVQGTYVCLRGSGKLTAQLPSTHVRATSQMTAEKLAKSKYRRAKKLPCTCIVHVSVVPMREVHSPEFFREDRLSALTSHAEDSRAVRAQREERKAEQREARLAQRARR